MSFLIPRDAEDFPGVVDVENVSRVPNDDEWDFGDSSRIGSLGIPEDTKELLGVLNDVKQIPEMPVYMEEISGMPNDVKGVPEIPDYSECILCISK